MISRAIIFDNRSPGRALPWAVPKRLACLLVALLVMLASHVAI